MVTGQVVRPVSSPVAPPATPSTRSPARGRTRYTSKPPTSRRVTTYCRANHAGGLAEVFGWSSVFSPSSSVRQEPRMVIFLHAHTARVRRPPSGHRRPPLFPPTLGRLHPR